MGWTFTYRRPGMTDREFFEREWEGSKFKFLATASKRRSVFYAVIERNDGKCGESFVLDADGKFRTCAVVLIKWVPRARDGYNFGYKEMTEESGPCEADCPARLLDMLSPINPEKLATDPAERCGPDYASNWRKRCRENADKAAAAIKLREGMKVKLPKPALFANGKRLDTFTVRYVRSRRGRRKVARFTNEDGWTYRLTRELRETLLPAP